jgi:hypothetical protein
LWKKETKRNKKRLQKAKVCYNRCNGYGCSPPHKADGSGKNAPNQKETPKGKKGYKGMNKAKKVITGIVGLPAVLTLLSEVEDLSLMWVQVVAVVIIFALMAWWGLLKRTKYDSNGYAIER